MSVSNKLYVSFTLHVLAIFFVLLRSLWLLFCPYWWFFSFCYQIVAVLNNHHESLAWLDEKSRYIFFAFLLSVCCLSANCLSAFDRVEWLFLSTFVISLTTLHINFPTYFQANAPGNSVSQEGNELPRSILSSKARWKIFTQACVNFHIFLLAVGNELM